MKLLTLLFFTIAACGDTSRQVLATDYDATCEVPADCVIIRVGACTEACGYPNTFAAINVKDAARAEQDFHNLDCGKATDSCNQPQPPTGVTCNNGQCGLQ